MLYSGGQILNNEKTAICRKDVSAFCFFNSCLHWVLFYLSKKGFQNTLNVRVFCLSFLILLSFSFNDDSLENSSSTFSSFLHCCHGNVSCFLRWRRAWGRCKPCKLQCLGRLADQWHVWFNKCNASQVFEDQPTSFPGPHLAFPGPASPQPK